MKNLTAALAASLALAACATPAPAEIATHTAPEHHNARTALDWAGTYQGTLPCASCSGIRTTLTLQDNGRYRLHEAYLDNPQSVFDSNGTFSWNAQGDSITLFGDGRRYFVAENHIIALSRDGSRITGELADAYILQKIH
ncbi:copper resistance protein NlpE [Uruburuella testudinis]|uniref:Copper resistance protein NlpE n=1 Tax=Uruburuella testudinis TaxID=1282863 RepID=A0ABY4DTB4_9NEIS|nr:copper resistance protein NlpE [Uruburuella testudinis]UOO82293.1 copper resistance protein NlpE [Uruburuella testudinis]